MAEELDMNAERERLVALVRNGPAPDGPVTGQSGAPSAGDAFTVDDLLATPDVASEEISVMPGKRAWVHSLAIERVCWLQAAAARWIAAESKKPGMSDEDRAARARYAGYVFQVIACLRQGPEATAPPVFRVEHADIVWRNLGWERIRKICELSDRLGGDEDLLGDTLRAFFSAAQTWAETWSGRLTTGSPEDGSAALARFADCVSRIRQRGMLTSGDLSEMREMAGV